MLASSSVVSNKLLYLTRDMIKDAIEAKSVSNRTSCVNFSIFLILFINSKTIG